MAHSCCILQTPREQVTAAGRSLPWKVPEGQPKGAQPGTAGTRGGFPGLCFPQPSHCGHHRTGCAAATAHGGFCWPHLPNCLYQWVPVVTSQCPTLLVGCWLGDSADVTTLALSPSPQGPPLWPWCPSPAFQAPSLDLTESQPRGIHHGKEIQG